MEILQYITRPSNDREKKSKNIERDIKKKFGWVINFTIDPDGSFHWQKVSGQDRYDLYPDMTNEQADDAVMNDIMTIIRKYIPNAKLTDYEQSGKHHVLEDMLK